MGQKLTQRTAITSGLTVNDLMHLVNTGDSWKVTLGTLLDALVGFLGFSFVSDGVDLNVSCNRNIHLTPLSSDPGEGLFEVLGDLNVTEILSVSGGDSPFKINHVSGDYQIYFPGYLGIVTFDHTIALLGFHEFGLADSVKLKLGNAAVEESPAATHTMLISDSTGTQYRVLCAE